jgi:hypothetical protein
VAPYLAVCNLPGLRISPLGVVPQRDRRPRLIVDYTYSKVNMETIPLAPREAMQFGRVVNRVVQTIAQSNPQYGAVYMGKIDIADGVYRVRLKPADVPKLGVALPGPPGCEPLVAFQLTLPMSWIESPPYFTAHTETACDLANTRLAGRCDDGPPHRLEQVAATRPANEDANQPR